MVIAERAERNATIRELAATCLSDAEGDWSKAATAMGERVRADRRLYKELMDPLVDGAIWSLIRKAASESRRSFWSSTTPVASTEDGKPDTRGLEAVGRANLMDYPLSGGLKVGDAFGDQLAKEADMYGGFARANARTERWLRLITDALPEGARVRDALTNDELERLQQQAIEDAD